MRETAALQPTARSTDRYQVRAVRRALDLLDCFTPSEPELTTPDCHCASLPWSATNSKT